MSGIYVEFFSDEALENVMCLLQYKPEKLIFLGHKSTMLTRKIKSLTKFAELKSKDTELEFIEGNTRARALYEKMGFRIAGIKPNAIRLKDGTFLNEYYMLREIHR